MIRRVLGHNVHTYADVIKFIIAEEILKDRKVLQLYFDGQLALVDHVGAYYPVHPCQLMKV